MKTEQIIIGTKSELIEHFGKLIDEVIPNRNVSDVKSNFMSNRHGIEYQLDEIIKNTTSLTNKNINVGMLFYFRKHPNPTIITGWETNSEIPEINIQVASSYVNILSDDYYNDLTKFKEELKTNI